jgi:DNA-3-methyladenine glycosylase II
MAKVLRLSPELVAEAVLHLRSQDPVMDRLIQTVGPFALKPQRDRFRTLVRAIVSQQISTRAAQSILAKLEAAAGPEGITPASLARLTPRRLRASGISPQKQAYLKDLAERVLSGNVRLARMGRIPDEEVIAELVQVKGIGRWTAQMFLIFTLGRPDVFPHDDLGVRTAIKRHYGLRELPDKGTAHVIAGPWRPFATVGSWYCWRSLALPQQSLPAAGERLKPGNGSGR